MRIIVDCLALGYGGSTTYLREMLPRLAQSSHEFFVIVERGKIAKLPSIPAPSETIEVAATLGNAYLRHAFQRTLLPRLVRDLGGEVLFVPSGMTGYENKLPGVRLVTMVRNMLPFTERERRRFSWQDYPGVRLRLEILSRALLDSYRRSDRVIFVSEHGREYLRRDLPNNECHVIKHGLSDCFKVRHPRPADFLRSAGIYKPYWLYISVLSPYKHQREVIKAFATLQKNEEARDRQLLLVGPGEGVYAREVVSSVVRSGGSVVWTGSLPFQDLPALAQHSELLLFGSTCENCPNILIEYLASGRPIICSETPPMPEFAADGAIYSSFESYEELADTIRGSLKRPQLLSQTVDASSRRTNEFSWDRSAQETLKALTDWN